IGFVNPVMPAGLGVREGALAVLLGWVAPWTIAAAVSLLFRVTVTLAEAVIVLFATGLQYRWLRRQRRFEPEDSAPSPAHAPSPPRPPILTVNVPAALVPATKRADGLGLESGIPRPGAPFPGRAPGALAPGAPASRASARPGLRAGVARPPAGRRRIRGDRTR